VGGELGISQICVTILTRRIGQQKILTHRGVGEINQQPGILIHSSPRDFYLCLHRLEIFLILCLLLLLLLSFVFNGCF